MTKSTELDNEEVKEDTGNGEDKEAVDFPMQFLYYITMLSTNIIGDDFGFDVQPARDENGEYIIAVTAGSFKYDELSITAIFPATEDAMGEARKAFVSFISKLYYLEQLKDKENSATGKLITPETKLWVPGDETQ